MSAAPSPAVVVDIDTSPTRESPPASAPLGLDGVVARALKETMLALDARFCDMAEQHRWRDGTCVCLCLLINSTLFTCNIGDCRAVQVHQPSPPLPLPHDQPSELPISNSIPVPIPTPTPVVTALSVDHSPSRPDERARIERAGGRVVWQDGDGYRVVPGGIAVSRAVGDYRAKGPRANSHSHTHTHTHTHTRKHTFGGAVLTAEPETTVTHLTPATRWIVVATDGVWQHASVDAVARAVAACTDCHAACRAVRAAALRAGSRDNIAVVTMAPVFVATCTTAFM